MTAEDLDTVARELVALYRQAIRFASPEDAIVAGRSLGGALAAVERARQNSTGEDVARDDLEFARYTLSDLLANVTARVSSQPRPPSDD